MLFLLFIGLAGCFAASLHLHADSDSETPGDPSIWSQRTWVDDFIDRITSWNDESNFDQAAAFESDFELKNVLLNSVRMGDWVSFERHQRNSLPDWRVIPEIEDLIKAMVNGPSVIILEMFLNDDRISLDERILRADSILFGRKNRLCYLAQAFDSKNLGTNSDGANFGFARSVQVYQIKQRIPWEWYLYSIPFRWTNEQKMSVEARKLIVLLAFNKRVPQPVVEFILKDTDLILDPVPFELVASKRLKIVPKNIKISLHALALLLNNNTFYDLIMNLERYQDAITKANTKTDEICKRIILTHYSKHTKHHK